MLELNQCYNMDCMKGMAQFPDGFFDLAVVDPPYFSGPERRGYYGSKVSKIGVYRDYPVSPVWEIPGRAYFDELRRVAKHYIVWGCNYFSYEFAPGRIVWASARKAPAFQTVSWPQLTYSTPCAYSGSCGTVCCKARALPRGISCRETKS